MQKLMKLKSKWVKIIIKGKMPKFQKILKKKTINLIFLNCALFAMNKVPAHFPLSSLGSTSHVKTQEIHRWDGMDSGP